MPRAALLLPLLFPLLALVGCSEPTRPQRVGAVELAPSAIQLASGAETTLVVLVSTADGKVLSGRPVSWSSSDSSLLSVDGTGRVAAGFVTAGSAASVEVSALVEGVVGKATVSIAPSPVAALLLDDAPLALAHGETASIAPTLLDAGGRALTGRPVTYFTRDPTVARVRADGLVTTAGFLDTLRTTYLVLGIGSLLDSVAVTVSGTTVASIAVTPGAVYLAPGRTKRLQARALSPAGIEILGSAVVWSSLDPSVATVATDGTVTAEALGAVTVRAELRTGSREVLVTVNECGSAPPGAYPIEIRYTPVPPATGIDAAFQCAAQRLRAVIVGAPVAPVTYVNFNANACVAGLTLNESINGLVIYATIESIDGPGQVLGSAGPCFIRADDGLPNVGRMRFDAADLHALADAGRLGDVILHEMLHVLGVGTVWGTKGVFAISSGGPRFTGQLAQEACITEHNGAMVCPNGVPVEDCVGIPGCGGGTINSHWKEPTFRNELMTGYLNSGVNPFSRMTIQSLADISYVVDPTQGDDYLVMPLPLLVDGGAGSAGPALRMPAPTRATHVVDRFGNATRIQY